ncbi:MAG: CYTH domain-containing protein [Bacteroidota bacterium]
MPQEIERKFLVTDAFREFVSDSFRITQGYLSSVPERIVRVRVRGEQGFITVKGISGSSGLSRYEWEKEIALNEARELLALCEPGIIDKTRFLVRVGESVFEVDEFHGENQGLVMAEIELASEDQPFERPLWLGAEVTGDKRYYNSSLAKKPYCQW